MPRAMRWESEDRRRAATAARAPAVPAERADGLGAAVRRGGVSNALLQRWEWPGWLGGDEDTAPGGDKELDEPPLGRFDYDRFIGGRPGFQLSYEPVGPAPEVGQITITMRVSIDFRDFSPDIEGANGERPFRGVRLTRAQRADQRWTPDEREEFSQNFRASVEQDWSAQHDFALSEEGFEDYRAALCVVVEVVPADQSSHHTIVAHKIPEGLSFRSYYSPADREAVLADEDVEEEEYFAEGEPVLLDRVGPFEHASHELDGALGGQVDAIADRMRPHQSDAPEHRDYLLTQDHWPLYDGRATESGSRSFNERLGLRRAETVRDAVADRLGRSGRPNIGDAGSHGEENASEDPEFRRVDVKLWLTSDMGPTPPTRTTAAHEAGHMFGLDDEYEDEEAPYRRFEGDRPDHYEDVRRLMGEEAAERVLVNDDESIMASGDVVQAEHYVYFLEVLNEVTEKTWSVVSGGGGSCSPTARRGAADRELPDGSRPLP